MLRWLRVHLDQVYGGVAAVTFVATTASLHLVVPDVSLLTMHALLLFVLGTLAAAGLVGAIGIAMRRFIATRLGRAGISPRTDSAVHYARVIAVILVATDIVLAFAFAWLAFTFVYGPIKT